MVAHILGASAPADDFSRRVILPPSASVRAPRFSTSRDWATSATVREVLDLIVLDVPQAPRPEPAEVSCESIEMSGIEVRSEFRTGSHIARRRFTCAFADDAPLAIASEPFAAMADDSIRGAAAERLRQMSRKPRSVPRRPVDAPPSGLRWTIVMWLAALIGLAAAVGGVLALLK
jgi:hypothetical protein